jgi:hypothetical protein
MLAAAINSFGLLLDIGGVVGLFFYGLPSEVVRASAVYEMVEEGSDKRYDRYARVALGALIFGFLLQLISNFIPGPPGGPTAGKPPPLFSSGCSGLAASA